MMAPHQFTLAIEHPHQQRLDNFVEGENGELLEVLKADAHGFGGYWICGALGSGCSHLLRGRCLAAQDASVTTSYIGCADFVEDQQGLAAALLHAGRYGHVVAVDDVAGIAGQVGLEEMLMVIYHRLLQEQGSLLIAHSQPARMLDFVTPDLASRMRSLQHFQIRSLDDSGKAQLLRQRARDRGYELAQPVLDYWLARGPRELGALLTDLAVLDKASLVHQQRVTIPLLKQVLGY